MREVSRCGKNRKSVWDALGPVAADRSVAMQPMTAKAQRKDLWRAFISGDDEPHPRSDLRCANSKATRNVGPVCESQNPKT